jgi:murein DD-endopeptidase MepM/ murein hydrolase activator NlpD
MFDQPQPCEGILKRVKPQVSNSPKAQAHLQGPVAQPERAAWHHSDARPTFVQIRKSASVGQIRRKIGVGLGGLAVAAVLGWAVARMSVERIAATEIEAPPRQADVLAVYPESGTSMPEAAALPPVEDVQSASREVPPPPEHVPSAAAPADAEPVAASSFEASVRLEKGDTLGSVLRELGFAAQDVADAIAALASHVSMKRLPVGQAMTVMMRPPDDAATAKPILLALTIRPEPRREITLERDDEGDYRVEVEVFDVVSKLQRASGAVDGSVIAGAEAAGVPRPALAEMLRAFSWDVNFQHDIKVGDRFDVLIEQSWTSDGKLVDPGRVQWAELTTGGGARSYSVYRFKPAGRAAFFYNRNGESVVRALLRTPLNMSRISSRFGLRRHPVLGFTRLHAGIDFAAPPGTPILAAGAGRVVEAGPNGGYGRWVKISHDGGLATGYAHLSRIAPGVRRSARVRQGQVIGFVGSSGLSTGPHLHFELHRQGRPVDPLSMARTQLRARLSGEDLARFKAHVVEIDRAREIAPAVEHQ